MSQSEAADIALELAKARRDMAALRAEVAEMERRVRSPRTTPYLMTRECYNCGKRGWCPHREPEVVAAEQAAWLARVNGSNGATFE